MNKPKLTIEELIQHCNRQCAKYERLAPYNYDDYSLHSPNYLEHYSIRQYLQELQHYKQLEEQGLLLVLPCKVGDTVYCLEEYVDGFDYAGYKFVSMCGNYCIVVAHYDHCENIEEQLEEMADECENLGHVSVAVIHKSRVFLTKEEAKKALEEMEGE